jgi:hypothetical protein
MTQLGTDLVKVVIQGGVTPERLRNGLTGKAVKQDTVLLRPSQPPLV